jgi:hypothetical protein
MAKCRWLDGVSKPYLQCDAEAVSVTSTGDDAPEGAIWCEYHRAKVFEPLRVLDWKEGVIRFVNKQN